ncbi:MAG: threonylcarbamoyl-AMP synthase [Desulfotignum sp.]|nr:threonylcarbamoyl-AMP synthase [Desulfotignum sp.]
MPDTSRPGPEARLNNPLRVIRIDPDHPALQALNRAAALIQNQGVVVFPTRCLYGLAADARNSSAIKKIFHIKHRPETNPLLILIHSPTDLEELVTHIPDAAQRLMQAFWPGGLTLVFEAAPCVSDLLTAGTGRIGVRIPSHPVARALVKLAGRPITGTSANWSGAPGCSHIKDLPQDLLRAADLVLDAGPLKGGTGSTILDVTCDPPRVIRQGRIPFDSIRQVIAL